MTHPDPAFRDAAVDDFLNRWMVGDGLLRTSKEAIDWGNKVLEIGKEFGY